MRNFNSYCKNFIIIIALLGGGYQTKLSAQINNDDINIYIYQDNNVISSLTHADSIVFRTPHKSMAQHDDECACNGCSQGSNLNRYTGIYDVTDFQPGYIATATSTVDITNVIQNRTFVHSVISCEPGEHFTITGKGGDSPRLWCFLDSLGDVLDVSMNDGWKKNHIITSPNNAVTLVVNFSISSEYSLTRGALNGVYLNDIENTIEDLNENIQAGQLSIGEMENGSFSSVTGSNISMENSLRSLSYLPLLTKSVSCDSKHKMGIYAWSKNNSFLGFWDGNAFAKSNRAMSTVWDIQRIRRTYPDINLKIVLVKDDNTTIDPIESKNISLTSVISNGIDEIETTNSTNILPKVTLSNSTRSGISYYAINGKIYLSGTSTNSFSLIIADSISGLPQDWVEGQKYHVHLSNSPNSQLYLQILEGQTTLLSTQTEGDIVVPQNPQSLVFRLFMRAGYTLDSVCVEPYVVKNYSNEQIESRIEKIRPSTIPAMLTIIDDDGNPKFKTDILPIIQSKHVSISSAVYNQGADRGIYVMTWGDILDCYRGGAEILSHTFDHQINYSDELTEEEIQLNYSKSRNDFLSRGIYGGRYLVYSGSTGNLQKSKNAAEKVFDLAINSSGNRINMPSSAFDKYNIQRYRIETDAYNYDLNALKALVDNCIANGGWMVWMFHTSSANWTPAAKANLEAVIDYAKQVGLPIVTVDYVYRTYLKNY